MACTGAHGQGLTTIYTFPTGVSVTANEALIEAPDAKGSRVLYGTTVNGGANGTGSIFTVSLSTGSVSTVYSFSAPTGSNSLSSPQPENTDGVAPDIGLTAGTGGLLYGACFNGGTYGQGTIYSFATKGPQAGTLTTLLNVNYSFSSGNALPPQSSDVCGLTLVLGPDGNFYGTSVNYDFNTSSPNYAAYDIFQITPSGGYTEVCYGLFGPPQMFFPSDFATTTPTLYGLVGPEGGITVADQFFVLPITSPPTMGGTASVLFTFDRPTSLSNTGYPVNNDGAFPVALFLGRDGNFYGATNDGGTNGNGTVFETASSGTAPTVLYTFSALAAFGGSNDDGANPTDLIQATDGILYGITSSGGATGNGTLFEVDSSLPEPFQVLGSFTPATGYPSGIMQASDGNLYGGTVGSGTSTLFEYPLAPPPGGIAVFDPSNNPVVSGGSAIDFGDGFTAANRPTVARLKFRIENTGADDLLIYCAVISGGPFAIAPKGQPAKKVRPHESTTLTLEMTPNQPVSIEGMPPAPSPEAGEAQIITNDPDMPVFYIELTGNGGGPALEVMKPRHKR